MSAEASSPTGDQPHTTIVVPEAKLSTLFEHMQEVLESVRQRREATVEEVVKRTTDADDEDVERLKDLLEPETSLVTHCVDIIGYCIKMQRARTMPYIGEVLGPYLMPLLTNKDSFMEPFRAAGICLCDDLIEYASPESHILLDTMLPALLDGASDADDLLRQSSVYGLGVCAVRAPDRVAPLAGKMVESLTAIIFAPGARSYESGSATDNAVSALIKLARHVSAAVDCDAIMGGVLAYLPFKHDGIEARLVHGWLVEAIATGDPLWLGADMSRMPAALRAVADAIIAHNANVAGGGGGGGGGGDDEEEHDDDDDEALLSEAHIAQLQATFAAAKASPMGATIMGIVRAMKPKQQAALAEYGLA